MTHYTLMYRVVQDNGTTSRWFPNAESHLAEWTSDDDPLQVWLRLKTLAHRDALVLSLTTGFTYEYHVHKEDR